MDLQRRKFFTVLFGAAATSTLITSPALAKLIIPDFNAIHTSIAKAKEIVKLSGPFYIGRYDTDKDLCEKVSILTGELFDFMMNQFKGTPDRYDVHLIFHNYNKNLDKLTVEYLTSISEDVVPVAIAKELLGKHKVPVVVSFMKPTWWRFVERYSSTLPGFYNPNALEKIMALPTESERRIAYNELDRKFRYDQA